MSSSNASNISLHRKPSNEACHQLHPRLSTLRHGKMIPCRKHRSKTKSGMCLGFCNTKIWVRIWQYDQNIDHYHPVVPLVFSHRFVFRYMKLSSWWLKPPTRKETHVKICANVWCRNLHHLLSLTTLGLILWAGIDSMFFGLHLHTWKKI